MDVSTETLGLTHGVELSLEGADDLLNEVSDKAENIMKKAFDEFNDFLKKKGLENRMGVLCPRDDMKVIYHITDIEWDIEADDTNAESLQTEFEADLYGDCIADYITKLEMTKQLEKFEKWLKAAQIGDTYIYNDSEYTLKILGEELPANIDAENITGEIVDYLSDNYYYLVKSYKVSVEIVKP